MIVIKLQQFKKRDKSTLMYDTKHSFYKYDDI